MKGTQKVHRSQITRRPPRKTSAPARPALQPRIVPTFYEKDGGVEKEQERTVPSHVTTALLVWAGLILAMIVFSVSAR